MLNAVLSALRECGESATEDEVCFSVEEDASLAGGIYLQIGDTVYDYTLDSMLERAKDGVTVLGHDGEDLVELLRAQLRQIRPEPDVYQTGTVVSVSRGSVMRSTVS